MSVTVIHDTIVVTADDAGAIHYGAAVVVDRGRVVAIGPTPETPWLWRGWLWLGGAAALLTVPSVPLVFGALCALAWRRLQLDR